MFFLSFLKSHKQTKSSSTCFFENKCAIFQVRSASPHIFQLSSEVITLPSNCLISNTGEFRTSFNNIFSKKLKTIFHCLELQRKKNAFSCLALLKSQRKFETHFKSWMIYNNFISKMPYTFPVVFKRLIFPTHRRIKNGWLFIVTKQLYVRTKFGQTFLHKNANSEFCENVHFLNIKRAPKCTIKVRSLINHFSSNGRFWETIQWR